MTAWNLSGLLAAAKVKKVFIVESEAWTWPIQPLRRDQRRVEEITFRFDPVEGGGTYAEAVMRWYDLSRVDAHIDAQKRPPVPRLEVFQDSWEMLHLAGLLPKLASFEAAGQNRELSPAEFVAILRSSGFEDATDRNPKKRKSLEETVRQREAELAKRNL